MWYPMQQKNGRNPEPERRRSKSQAMGSNSHTNFKKTVFQIIIIVAVTCDFHEQF